jgi:hypothetical protein
MGGSCDHGLAAFAFDGLLSAKGETWAQPLGVTLPRLDVQKLVGCNATEDETQRETCVTSDVTFKPPGPIQDCGGLQLDPDAIGRCIIAALPSPWNAFADCAMGINRNNPVACFSIFAPGLAPDFGQKLVAINNRISSAGPEVSKESISYFLQLLPGDYGALGACLAVDSFADLTLKLRCASGVPQLRAGARFVTCTMGQNSIQNLLIRCSPEIGITLPKHESLLRESK